MVRLAIVGSTTFADAWDDEVREIIGDHLDRLHPVLVISGGALGVDSWAVDEAKALGIPTREYLPEHRRWAPTGFKARNILIATNCTHLLRVYCPHGRTYGSGWTADYAERLGRTVTRIAVPPPP